MQFQQELAEEFVRGFVNRWWAEFKWHSVFLCSNPLQLSDGLLAFSLSSSEQRLQLFREDEQALVPLRIGVLLRFRPHASKLAIALGARRGLARTGEIAAPNSRECVGVVKSQLRQ